MAHWIKEEFSFYYLQRILSKLIEGTDVFAGLTQAELVKLLEHAEKCTFAAREAILREGSSGEFLYVLIEGSVRIEKGVGDQAKELARLVPGNIFGEMSLVDHAERSASVIAIERCVLLRIGETDCWRHPAIAAKIFRNLAYVVVQRLREMDDVYFFGKCRSAG